MKKLWLRVCSMILVMVMLLNCLPIGAFAEQNESSPQTETANESTEYENAEILEEITERRTKYTKEFLLDNGLTMAVVAQGTVLCVDAEPSICYTQNGDAICQDRQERKAKVKYIMLC